MAHSDIVFGNETEADAFGEAMKYDTKDRIEIAKKIAAMPLEGASPRSRVVVITQGPDPVIVVQNGKVTECHVTKLASDKIVDTNGDGTVDMKELTNIIEQYDTDGVIYKALSQRLEIRQEFQKYDKDNSGFITRDELVQVVKDRTGMAISERHLEGMLQGCDENDDGQMDYEEFCTLMTKSFMRKKIVGRSKTALSALQTIKGQ